jgi:hypothetical protein
MYILIPQYLCNDCENLEVTGGHLLGRGCIIMICVWMV